MVKRMQRRVGPFMRRAVISISLSASVLAIANLDTIWQERMHEGDYAGLKVHASTGGGRARLTSSPASRLSGVNELTMTEQLSGSFNQDELGEQNPFATLSTLDPLNAMFGRGVIHFQRQVYRSAEYREEVGYDIVSYEIEHKDHSHSSILAYLERPLVDQGAETKPVPVVLILETRDGISHQSVYRSGSLQDERDIPLSQAQALVSHKLNSGIPFISVAR